MNLKYFLPEGLNAIIRRMRSAKYRNRTVDHTYEKTNHNRISLIVKALSTFGHKNTNYLEIGCFKDEVFNSIPLLSNQKKGVDPQQGGNIRLKSDDFFAQNKESFNVIFIDGLHHYEQVHRDVENSLKFLKKDGIILIHDMIPDSELSSRRHRDKFTSNWSGDVFRICFDLINHSKIKFKIANVDFGVGIIIKSTSYIHETLKKNNTDYEFFLKNKHELPIISTKEAFEFIEKRGG